MFLRNVGETILSLVQSIEQVTGSIEALVFTWRRRQKLVSVTLCFKLKKYRTMDNFQNNNNCINILSSQMFRFYIHWLEPLGWRISTSQMLLSTLGSTDTERTHAHIHISTGIQTHDSSVPAGEDISCRRPRCRRVRHVQFTSLLYL
jgi:hypothetical protein